LIWLQQDASPNSGKITRSVSPVSLFYFIFLERHAAYGVLRARSAASTAFADRSRDRLDALTDLMLGAEPRIRAL
jgi:hypothetical protein